MNVMGSVPARQQGMALVMGLIILLVMTLVSIGAMRMTLMQEKMSGAFQGQQLAFHAAEAALRDAERRLGESSVPLGSQGFFDAQNSNREPPDWSDPSASLGVGEALKYDQSTLNNVARQPQFYVERKRQSCEKPDPEAGPPVNENSYRVVARGFGGNESNQVVLETYYCR